ncbi:MAG: hypothetical protein L3J47_12760 [Sulfurovum sp.]|nr:hypothetical protein [Sulfurovum sp.]
MCELSGLSRQEMETLTTENAQRLFAIAC